MNRDNISCPEIFFQIFSGKTRWLLFFILVSSLRLGAQPDPFAGLKHLPDNEKFTSATKIYSASIKPLDSVQAIAALQQLIDHARIKRDRVLEVIGNGLMGIYYERRCMDKDRGKVYYQEGLGLSQTYHIRTAEIWLNHQLGMLYYSNRQYPLAFEHLLRAHAAMQMLGYNNIPDATRYLFELAYVYYEFGDYKEAIAYLQKVPAYDSTSDDLWHHMSVNNTLALAYQHLSMIDSAVIYFYKAFDIAAKRQDTVWIGIISGNLGHIYYKNKDYEKAFPLLEYDLEISKKYEVWSSVVACYLTFTEVAIDCDSLRLARRYIDSTRIYIPRTGDDSVFYSISLRKNLSNYYRKINNMELAYAYLDTFVRLRDSLNLQKDIRMLAQVEGKVQTERHLANLQLIKSEKSRQIMLRNAVVVVLVLFIIIVLEVLYRIRMKQKKDRKIFLLERKRAQDDIRNANNTLDSYIKSIREKNQLIEGFKEEIQKLKDISVQSVSEQEEMIEKLHYVTILTEADWIEFKRLFVKVYKGFFDTLDAKYPDLTQAETRLLALTKLKLSVNEMANMLGISADAVRKTRLRLRKKINLPEHIDLEDIVN